MGVLQVMAVILFLLRSQELAVVVVALQPLVVRVVRAVAHIHPILLAQGLIVKVTQAETVAQTTQLTLRVAGVVVQVR